MSMRKIRRALAKSAMKKRGVEKINRNIKNGKWRKVLGASAYPSFHGKAWQRKGSTQPILKY